MKIACKEILPRKDLPKSANVGSPLPKHKGMSKSLSKPIKIGEPTTESPKKKCKDLKVIKEVVKKRKEEKKESTKGADKDRDRKKKVNYCLNLKELKPVNLEKEKELFFQN